MGKAPASESGRYNAKGQATTGTFGRGGLVLPNGE
jgi:hypothetical protein